MTPPGGLLLRVAEWWLGPTRTTSRIVPAIADEQYLWHIACSRGQSLSALARRLGLPWLVLRLCIACEIQDRLRALASVQWWLALPTLGWAMIGGALSHNVGAALWIAFGCAGFFVQATSYQEASRSPSRTAPVAAVLFLVGAAWMGPILIGGYQWARVASTSFHVGLLVVPWLVGGLAGLKSPARLIASGVLLGLAALQPDHLFAGVAYAGLLAASAPKDVRRLLWLAPLVAVAFWRSAPTVPNDPGMRLVLVTFFVVGVQVLIARWAYRLQQGRARVASFRAALAMAVALPVLGWLVDGKVAFTSGAVGPLHFATLAIMGMLSRAQSTERPMVGV